MKDTILIGLIIVCIALIVDNRKMYTELSTLKDELSFFDVSTATWPNGEKLLFIYGIPGYEIGFALDKDKNMFWHEISKLTSLGTFNVGEFGVCSNGRLAARPSNCNRPTASYEMTHANAPRCILR